MKKAFLWASAIAVMAGCQPNTDATNSNQSSSEPPAQLASVKAMSESERLNQWFAEKYEQQLQMSPLMMTFLGRKDKYDQFDDLSEQAEIEQLAWVKAAAKELESQFDYQKLDQDAKISYDIWLYQYNQALKNDKFRNSGYVFTQMQGVQAFFPQFLINFHKVEDLSDMQAYIKRIGGVSRGISQLLARAQSRAKQGVRPPRFAYEGVLQQARGIIAGQPFNDVEQASPLWADAQAKVAKLVEGEKIDQAQADQLLADVKKALNEQLQPAYQALVTWFEADIDNTDIVATGVGKQPNGEAYYNHQLNAHTTTDLTADEVHNIGLAEVARIQKEMVAIKDKVGFEGDLKEFFKFIKDDKRFYYNNDDQGRQGYIDDTEAYLDAINKQLPKFFGILPKADLVVKRVEPFREQDGAAQHYFPGAPDGSRPGVYYAHLSDMNAMPKSEMEAIAYHEGNPGHHMQISIAQELTSVPEFRTQARFTVYSEGWGLYAELLAKEMGGYQDDYSDFGRLITEIWRAVRLVVDTGLHSKGWTEQQAIDYFKDNAPVAYDAIVSEVRRYIVWPGQATAYKVGMLKILELRAKAEKALGDKFDIRGFHDTVLGGGAMPLAILETRVDQWIAKVQASN